MADNQKDIIQELKARLAALEADPQNDLREKIDAMNELARASLAYELVESEQLSQQAHQLATNLEPAYQIGILHSLDTLGTANYCLGNYNLALQYGLDALNMAEALQMLDQRPTILKNIGSVYYDLGDYPTAMQYFHLQYQAAQQTNNLWDEAEALNVLGLIYDITRAHERALEFYQQSYMLYQTQNNTAGMKKVLSNRALTYINLQNYPAALADGLQAIDLERFQRDDRGLIYSLGVTGVAYFEMGAYDLALHYFQQALVKATALGNRMLVATALKEIGKVYHRQVMVASALHHLQQALEIATEIDAKSEMFECHQLLSKIYEQQNDLLKALHHYKLYHHIEKEVFNQEADKKIKNLQVIYDTEKAKQEAELTRQKNTELEQEVAERRRAESEAQHRSKELLVLAEVGQEISSTLDLPIVLERIATRAKYLLQADMIAIFLRQPNQNTFQPTFVLGQEAEALRNWTVTLGEGITGHIAQTGVAEIINDTAQDPRAVHIPNTTNTSPHTEAMMCVPLIAQKNVIGLITLWRNPEIKTFAEHDLNFLVGLSQQAVIAIENARLFNEARQAKEEAEAANRTKSIFLANMSHELRTPLNSILGFSELMMREFLSNKASLNPEQKSNLQTILRSGEHLLGLINDVLELSKIEAGHIVLKPEIFNLPHMLLGLEEMFRIRAEVKGLQLAFECGADVPPYIRADQGKLRQILINLLGNAVKFTHQGGITLRVAGEVENEAPFTCRLRFAVEDTGVGIAPDELETLFDMFVQTKSGRESGQGTGLGLPISHKFARLLGGDLTVRSQEGQGTCFELYIPVTVTDAPDMQDEMYPARVIGLSPQRCTAPDGAPYRLLIVEDEPENRMLLTKLLTSLGEPPTGFEVRSATNGKEAVQIWAGWYPHLIWMDLRMPEMDGYETTRHIRAACQGDHCPIIIALTASALQEERSIALAAGCDDFIRKPFREAEIFGLLSSHLHVTFVYETPSASNQGDAKDQPAQALMSQDAIAAELKKAPASWRTKFQQAVLEGDVMWIATLIQQIAPQHPALANVLNDLAEKFNYRQLLNLIQLAQ